MLDIEGLTIALPASGERLQAVSNAHLTVGPGEMVCLVGESGSGKSVIAQAIMGLLPTALRATSGRICLDGEDVLAASPSRLRELRCTRMSMIFQEPMTALNPVLRCGEQIDEVLATHTDMTRAQRRDRILEIVRDVGLPDPARMIESYPHQLSGGQRQRVMIAMALVLNPRLLIADEPTTALDVTTQAQILALIREMQREHGTGVLFITHDFGVVAEIAERVAVLRQGEVVEFGPAHELLVHPQHEYTRMLIAAVPSLTPRHRSIATDAPDRGQHAGPGQVVRPWQVVGPRWRCAGGRPTWTCRFAVAKRWASSANRARASRPSRAASRGSSSRPPATSCSTASTSRGSAPARCVRCVAACRSSSRTRIARSIRAAPSAMRWSKAR